MKILTIFNKHKIQFIILFIQIIIFVKICISINDSLSQEYNSELININELKYENEILKEHIASQKNRLILAQNELADAKNKIKTLTENRELDIAKEREALKRFREKLYEIKKNSIE